MNGWILYKKIVTQIKPEIYEINRLIEVAKKRGIVMEVLKPEEFELYVTSDDRKSIMVHNKSVSLPDFFLPRMGADTTYFGLAVIRHLERLGVCTFNSAASVYKVKDKLYTQQILAEQNLPVPKTMLAKFPVDSTRVDKMMGFPVIVKTLSGTQGSGVFLSENKTKFEDLMQLIQAAKSTTNIILQEYIKTSRGRDLRAFVIGGRVVACMERQAHDSSFKANFSRGGQVKAHPITPEIEWLARESSRILELDIAGIDLLFDEGHLKICEANSSPAFEGIEKCCDISIPDEIYNYVKLRLGVR
jgi:gamma-F420-2:alpha-L-glutamate ligase